MERGHDFPIPHAGTNAPLNDLLLTGVVLRACSPAGLIGPSGGFRSSGDGFLGLSGGLWSFGLHGYLVRVYLLLK